MAVAQKGLNAAQSGWALARSESYSEWRLTGDGFTYWLILSKTDPAKLLDLPGDNALEATELMEFALNGTLSGSFAQKIR